MLAPLIYPAPPRETVPSMAARYRASLRAGTVGAGDFFGGPSNTASSLLPTGLGRLFDRLPESILGSRGSFIKDHTAVRFFLPFLDSRRAALAQTALWTGGNLHLLLGLVPHGTFEAERPRTCPHCLREDVIRYGFAYWHLEHQFRFLAHCTVHQVLLREALISRRPSICSANYPLLTAQTETQRIMVPPDPAGALTELATDTAWLMDRPLITVGLDLIHAALYGTMRQRGFVRLDGSVKIRRLTASLVEYFGNEFLKWAGCLPTGAVHANWIAQISRRPRCLTSPIKVLLVAHYFGLNAKALLKSAGAVSPREVRVPARSHRFKVRSSDRLRDLLPKKRAQWLILRERPMTALKMRIYSWLWRNDREWVHCNRCTIARKSTCRRAWGSIDRRLARKIMATGKELRRLWPPVRASRHRLASLTKHAHYLLRGDMRRLPKSVHALKCSQELVVDYACRRIRMVAKQYPGVRRRKPWRLLVAAGIGGTQRGDPRIRWTLSELYQRHDL